jgi:SNF2 family DNA or RNA helicase
MDVFRMDAGGKSRIDCCVFFPERASQEENELLTCRLSLDGRVQEALRPLLLRRMKEDVETLPDKEEIIIWVELTNYQRSYYKALYENQIGALLGGGKNAALPNMRNLAMELRKVCCHPVCFLPSPARAMLSASTVLLVVSACHCFATCECKFSLLCAQRVGWVR